MTKEMPKASWRGGVLRAVCAIAVLVAPIAVAMWSMRIRSGVPVQVMAWISAVWLVAYPLLRAARRGVKRDYTVENLAWLIALLIALLAISPTTFPWDRP